MSLISFLVILRDGVKTQQLSFSGFGDEEKSWKHNEIVFWNKILSDDISNIFVSILYSSDFKSLKARDTTKIDL